MTLRFHFRTCLSFLVTGVLIASVGSAGPVRSGALVVSATPTGVCEIDGSIRGPSPVVAILPAGEHAATCSVDVGGISVARSAKARVEAGRATTLVIELGIPVTAPTKGAP